MSEQQTEDKDQVPEEWDFYPCRVDDAPASILLNLGLERVAPLAEAPTLYWCSITMQDPDEHGMGSRDEAETLYAVEDTIVPAVAKAGFVQAGRLRNLGTWQLSFFAAEGLESVLEAAAIAAAPRETEVGSKPDADWSYYFDFLLPDAERRQWIMDRRVVEHLMDHGDPLTPRPVDHFIYFEQPEQRQAFADAAQAIGFTIESLHEADGKDDWTYCAHLIRVDSVEVEEIHKVVMTLHELAERHDGDYDGWGTASVVKPTS